MPVPKLIDALLAADEPPPTWSFGRPSGRFFLVCDHAGRQLPRSMGSMGLSPADLESHIAWDIGAAAVATRMAEALDGQLVAQNYSRLVIDCNRPLGATGSIVPCSAGILIPGNAQISRGEAERRAQAIFHPYHDRIRAELDRRQAEEQPTILVAMHSFTPRFLGVDRPWHAGILYRERRLAVPLLELLRRETGLVVGDNEPYAVGDLTDYAIVEHGERRGIPHVEIEVRQDLVQEPSGQVEWAERFARVLREASARLPF